MPLELEDFIMSGTNQARLLATLYRDEKFFLAAKRATLRANDFAMQTCAMVFGILSDYRDKYGKMPSMSTLQDLVVDKAKEEMEGVVDEETARELCWILNTMAGDSVLDYKYACEKLVKFIESARISRVALADPNNTQLLKDAVSSVSDISVEETESNQVSLLGDGLDLLPQTKEQVDVKIPTGLAWLDFVTNGGLSVTDHEIGVGMAGTGVGKALPNDDPIPTPDGWKKVGDIREGDFLFGADGKPVKVLKVHPQPEKKKIWIVKFVDGRLVRCCKDHLWEIFLGKTSCGELKRNLVDTAELQKLVKSKEFSRVCIRNTPPVEYPDNGTSETEAFTDVQFHVHDKQPFDKKYLTAPREVRKCLLEGLLESTLCIDAASGFETGEFTLDTKDPELAERIVELCRSLGYPTVCLYGFLSEPLMPVEHPKELCFGAKFRICIQKTRVATVEVIDVYEATMPKTDMTCFTVDADDGLFLCDQYVVTHNTNMMINFAIAAAFAGFRSLFITLELTKKQIIRRAIGMMAHIRTSEMRLPTEQWSKESKERLEYLKASKIADYIRVSEMADRSYAVSDLVGEIEKWKKGVRASTGDDSKCCLVIIDWLDMLVPEQKDMKLLGQEWQALKKVMEDVRHMANNQEVAVWTVMQTNRQGSGASKVRLDHVSGAFGKNFYASLVIGLAPVDASEEDNTISQDIRDDELSKVKTECDRDLHINIIKNRDGVQREADIYQGPTLRFWKNKSAWRTTEKMLEKGDLVGLFGNIK